MKDRLKLIWDWVLGLFVACIFIFAILSYYFSDSSYMTENPYVYNNKYYHKPTKAQLFDLMNKLTNNDSGYYDEVYIHKGMPSDSMILSRYFYQDKKYEIIRNLEKDDNIFLLKDEHYCLGEINIDIHTIDRLGVSIFWGGVDKCRMYWWEGKNPRGLQSDIFKEYHKNGKKYNL